MPCRATAASPILSGAPVRAWIEAARRLAALSGLAVVTMVALPAHATEPPKSVLVLYSNGRLLPANIEGDRGLRDTIRSTPERPVTIFDEFLDTPRFGGPDYERTLLAYLHDKYAQRPPDVVVAAGEQALKFLVDQRGALFPGTPIVHMGVSAEALASIAKRPASVFGAPVTYDFAGTIDLALRLHPAATRLVVVTGASAPDREWEAASRAATERLRHKVGVEFLSGLPTSAVLERMRLLGAGTVVFTPGYFADGAGQTFIPREAARAIASASGAPVYSPFDPFIGTGVVGGVVPSFTAMGVGAAAIVDRILDGSQGEAPVPAGPEVNVPTVDWRAIQRWKIAESALPPGTAIRFRQPTLFEAHRREVIAALAVVLLQAGLIAGLLLERRRRVLAERSVQAQRIELAHASRLAVAGELTGAIAHEINQPLGAILANADAADLLLASGIARHDDLRAILADIRRDDMRASEVIRRLRALLGNHAVEREPVAIGDVIRDSEPVLRAEARRRGVALHVRSTPAGATVRADRVQLQQVLINLVLNAMEAIGDVADGERIVTIGTERVDDQVVVEVRDTGGGIAPEHMSRLFDSFFTTKRKGMGLGLSIARTIVEAHGGRIAAENGTTGAVFRITLPVLAAAAAQAKAAAP
jgi:signal transduction histidine kinase